MRKILAWVKFTWFLWRKVKYDGTGHRITLWYALTLASDRKFWGAL